MARLKANTLLARLEICREWKGFRGIKQDSAKEHVHFMHVANARSGTVASYQNSWPVVVVTAR